MERRKNLDLMLSTMVVFVLMTLNTSYAIATALAHQPSSVHLALLTTSLFGIGFGLLCCMHAAIRKMMGHQVGQAHVWPARLTLALICGLAVGFLLGVAGVTGKWV